MLKNVSITRPPQNNTREIGHIILLLQPTVLNLMYEI